MEQGCRVSRLSATIRVSRDRRAPWVLWAVRNLLSFEAGLHPGDTSTAWTPGPRGASVLSTYDPMVEKPYCITGEQSSLQGWGGVTLSSREVYVSWQIFTIQVSEPMEACRC